MTVDVLQKPSFFRFLSAIDSDLANRARLQGCNFCGGTLHSACYPRKPRGGSIELETTAPAIRQSFCCNNSRIGALSRATGLSWVCHGFVERNAVWRNRQPDQRITLEPWGGTADIAEVAARVARDIRGNPILEFQQRSVYAANRACSLAEHPAGAF